MSSKGDSCGDNPLKRWHLRFQRAQAFWNQPSDRFADIDEQFNYLVEVLVTASYLEMLLYVGVQYVGVDMDGGRKRPTLGTLIRIAREYGLVDGDLAKLLNQFNDIRNGFAHNPDYVLTTDTINTLHGLLPQDDQDALKPALQ